jgi:hypothetical protein
LYTPDLPLGLPAPPVTALWLVPGTALLRRFDASRDLQRLYTRSPTARILEALCSSQQPPAPQALRQTTMMMQCWRRMTEIEIQLKKQMNYSLAFLLFWVRRGPLWEEMESQQNRVH